MILETLNPHVTSVLHGHGFGKWGKRNPTYHRTRDERIELINIQGNDYNTKTKGSFTVNVAVFFPTLDPIVSPHPVDERPEEYWCPIRARVPRIDTDGRPSDQDLIPHWWEFGPTIDPAEVGRHVAGEIEARALPFFERHSDRRALLEALRSKEIRTHELWTAAIAAWAGDRAYAEQVLESGLAAIEPGKAAGMFRRRAAIIAESLGLAFARPDAEQRLVVTMVCPDDASRDETDYIYWKLYSGLMRILPNGGPDYLFDVDSKQQGHTQAVLFGPDREALIERISGVLDGVAAQRAGSGRPVWTLS